MRTDVGTLKQNYGVINGVNLSAVTKGFMHKQLKK